MAGTELYYERAGAGEPLLLIQGMSGTHMAWGRPFLSPLERDFDCIVFDNRGIGRSGAVAEPFTIAEMAADAAGLLEALEVESAHVLGISMGGMIAQELALAEPERLRSLTLGCTYAGGPGSRLMDPADFAALAEAMGSGVQERVFRAMWELNLSPGFRAEEDRYRRLRRDGRGAAGAAAHGRAAAAGDRRPRHPATACRASRRRPWSSTAPSTACSESPTGRRSTRCCRARACSCSRTSATCSGGSSRGARPSWSAPTRSPPRPERRAAQLLASSAQPAGSSLPLTLNT